MYTNDSHLYKNPKFRNIKLTSDFLPRNDLLDSMGETNVTKAGWLLTEDTHRRCVDVSVYRGIVYREMAGT